MNMPNFAGLGTAVTDRASDLFGQRDDAVSMARDAADTVAKKAKQLPAAVYSQLPSVKKRRRRQRIGIAIGVILAAIVGREIWKRWKLRRRMTDAEVAGTATPSLSTARYRRSSSA